MAGLFDNADDKNAFSSALESLGDANRAAEELKGLRDNRDAEIAQIQAYRDQQDRKAQAQIKADEYKESLIPWEAETAIDRWRGGFLRYATAFNTLGMMSDQTAEGFIEQQNTYEQGLKMGMEQSNLSSFRKEANNVIGAVSQTISQATGGGLRFLPGIGQAAGLSAYASWGLSTAAETHKDLKARGYSDEDAWKQGVLEGSIEHGFMLLTAGLGKTRMFRGLGGVEGMWLNKMGAGEAASRVAGLSKPTKMFRDVFSRATRGQARTMLTGVGGEMFEELGTEIVTNFNRAGRLPMLGLDGVRGDERIADWTNENYDDYRFFTEAPMIKTLREVGWYTMTTMGVIHSPGVINSALADFSENPSRKNARAAREVLKKLGIEQDFNQVGGREAAKALYDQLRDKGMSDKTILEMAAANGVRLPVDPDLEYSEGMPIGLEGAHEVQGGVFAGEATNREAAAIEAVETMFMDYHAKLDTGINIRFYDGGPEGINGKTVVGPDGQATIWLSRNYAHMYARGEIDAFDLRDAMNGVYVHELHDAIVNTKNGELAASLKKAMEEYAPEEVAAAREKYKKDHTAAGLGTLTEADLDREAISMVIQNRLERGDVGLLHHFAGRDLGLFSRIRQHSYKRRHALRKDPFHDQLFNMLNEVGAARRLTPELVPPGPETATEAAEELLGVDPEAEVEVAPEESTSEREDSPRVREERRRRESRLRKKRGERRVRRILDKHKDETVEESNERLAPMLGQEVYAYDEETGVTERVVLEDLVDDALPEAIAGGRLYKKVHILGLAPEVSGSTTGEAERSVESMDEDQVVLESASRDTESEDLASSIHEDEMDARAREAEDFDDVVSEAATEDSYGEEFEEMLDPDDESNYDAVEESTPESRVEAAAEEHDLEVEEGLNPPTVDRTLARELAPAAIRVPGGGLTDVVLVADPNEDPSLGVTADPDEIMTTPSEAAVRLSKELESTRKDIAATMPFESASVGQRQRYADEYNRKMEDWKGRGKNTPPVTSDLEDLALAQYLEDNGKFDEENWNSAKYVLGSRTINPEYRGLLDGMNDLQLDFEVLLRVKDYKRQTEALAGGTQAKKLALIEEAAKRSVMPRASRRRLQSEDNEAETSDGTLNREGSFAEEQGRQRRVSATAQLQDSGYSPDQIYNLQGNLGAMEFLLERGISPEYVEISPSGVMTIDRKSGYVEAARKIDQAEIEARQVREAATTMSLVEDILSGVPVEEVPQASEIAEAAEVTAGRVSREEPLGVQDEGPLSGLSERQQAEFWKWSGILSDDPEWADTIKKYQFKFGGLKDFDPALIQNMVDKAVVSAIKGFDPAKGTFETYLRNKLFNGFRELNRNNEKKKERESRGGLTREERLAKIDVTDPELDLTDPQEAEDLHQALVEQNDRNESRDRQRVALTGVSAKRRKSTPTKKRKMVNKGIVGALQQVQDENGEPVSEVAAVVDMLDETDANRSFWSVETLEENADDIQAALGSVLENLQEAGKGETKLAERIGDLQLQIRSEQEEPAGGWSDGPMILTLDEAADRQAEEKAVADLEVNVLDLEDSERTNPSVPAPEAPTLKREDIKPNDFFVVRGGDETQIVFFKESNYDWDSELPVEAIDGRTYVAVEDPDSGEWWLQPSIEARDFRIDELVRAPVESMPRNEFGEVRIESFRGIRKEKPESTEELREMQQEARDRAKRPAPLAGKMQEAKAARIQKRINEAEEWLRTHAPDATYKDRTSVPYENQAAVDDQFSLIADSQRKLNEVRRQMENISEGDTVESASLGEDFEMKAAVVSKLAVNIIEETPWGKSRKAALKAGAPADSYNPFEGSPPHPHYRIMQNMLASGNPDTVAAKVANRLAEVLPDEPGKLDKLEGHLRRLSSQLSSFQEGPELRKMRKEAPSELATLVDWMWSAPKGFLPSGQPVFHDRKDYGFEKATERLSPDVEGVIRLGLITGEWPDGWQKIINDRADRFSPQAMGAVESFSISDPNQSQSKRQEKYYEVKVTNFDGKTKAILPPHAGSSMTRPKGKQIKVKLLGGLKSNKAVDVGKKFNLEIDAEEGADLRTFAHTVVRQLSEGTHRVAIANDEVPEGMKTFFERAAEGETAAEMADRTSHKVGQIPAAEALDIVNEPDSEWMFVGDTAFENDINATLGSVDRRVRSQLKREADARLEDDLMTAGELEDRKAKLTKVIKNKVAEQVSARQANAGKVTLFRKSDVAETAKPVAADILAVLEKTDNHRLGLDAAISAEIKSLLHDQSEEWPEFSPDNFRTEKWLEFCAFYATFLLQNTVHADLKEGVEQDNATRDALRLYGLVRDASPKKAVEWIERHVGDWITVKGPDKKTRAELRKNSNTRNLIALFGPQESTEHRRALGIEGETVGEGDAEQKAKFSPGYVLLRKLFAQAKDPAVRNRIRQLTEGWGGSIPADMTHEQVMEIFRQDAHLHPANDLSLFMEDLEQNSLDAARLVGQVWSGMFSFMLGNSSILGDPANQMNMLHFMSVTGGLKDLNPFGIEHRTKPDLTELGKAEQALIKKQNENSLPGKIRGKGGKFRKARSVVAQVVQDLFYGQPMDEDVERKVQAIYGSDGFMDAVYEEAVKQIQANGGPRLSVGEAKRLIAGDFETNLAGMGADVGYGKTLIRLNKVVSTLRSAFAERDRIVKNHTGESRAEHYNREISKEENRSKEIDKTETSESASVSDAFSLRDVGGEGGRKGRRSTPEARRQEEARRYEAIRAQAISEREEDDARKKTDRVVRQEALAKVKRLGEVGIIKQAVDVARRGTRMAFNDVDQVALTMAINNLSASGMKEHAEAISLAMGASMTIASEFARGLRASGTVLDEEGQRLRSMNKAVFAPSRKLQKRLEKLRSEGRPMEAERVHKEWANGTGEFAGKGLPALHQYLRSMGVDPFALKNMKNDPYYANRVLNLSEQHKADLMDGASEFFRNSILGAITTQVSNIVGTVPFFLWEVGVKRNLEALANLAVQDPHLPTFSENAVIFKHLIKSQGVGASFGLRAFKEEAPVVESMLGFEGRGGGSTKIEGMRTAIKGKLGKGIRIPQNVLLGFDEYMKWTMSNAFAAGYAFRTARAAVKKGAIRPEESAMFMDKLLENKDKAVFTPAMNESLRLLWQAPLGEAGSKIVQLRETIKPLRFVMPFIVTPLNIFKTGVRLSPLGTANLLWKAAVARREGQSIENTWRKLSPLVMEQGLSWMMLFAIMGLRDPDDPDEDWITGSAQEWEAGPRGASGREGMPPPFSVKLGNSWVSYERIEPFATVLATLVDAAQGLQSGSVEAISGNTAKSLYGQLYNKTFTRSFADMVDAAHNWRERGFYSGAGHWATNFATAWIPNYIRSTGRALQEKVPERGIWGNENEKKNRTYDRLRAKTELGLVDNTPKVDLWGREIDRNNIYGPSSSFLYQLIVPARMKSSDLFVGDRVLLRWNAEHAETDKARYPEAPDKHMDFNGERRNFSDQQYHEYAKLSGEIARQLVGTTNLNVDNPTENDISLITDTLSRSKAIAREILGPKFFGKGAVRERYTVLDLADEIRNRQIASWANKLSAKPPTMKNLSKDQKKLPPEARAGILQGLKDDLEEEQQQALEKLEQTGVDLQTALRQYGGGRTGRMRVATAMRGRMG